MTQLLAEEGEPFTPVRGHIHDPASQGRTMYKGFGPERGFEFFSGGGGAHHLSGPENPIDFTRDKRIAEIN